MICTDFPAQADLGEMRRPHPDRRTSVRRAVKNGGKKSSDLPAQADLGEMRRPHPVRRTSVRQGRQAAQVGKYGKHLF